MKRKNLRKDAIPTIFDNPNPPKSEKTRRQILKRQCDNINVNDNVKKFRGVYHLLFLFISIVCLEFYMNAIVFCFVLFFVFLTFDFSCLFVLDFCQFSYNLMWLL